MSEFNSLYELLNTITGMTALRSNSGQDDGTDSVSGVDWFSFNGVVASTIYVNGNSWVGFGSSTEHLKICRRDGKMWYLYRQEGIVGSRKFLKIRWEGYTQHNYTSAGYALKWELFLFDDGGMYLNLIDVPDTSGYLGESLLTYTGGTLTIPIALSTPVAYSLLPLDGSFLLSAEAYPGTIPYVMSGYFECQTTAIRQAMALSGSAILWSQDVPDGTEINVYVKLSDGEYIQCENGGEIACLQAGVDLSDETLYIKVELLTSNVYVSPVFSNLYIRLFQDGDDNIIVLKFEDGMFTSIRNAVGEVTVQYIGTMLEGADGPVLGFRKKFMPEGLYMKPNPHDAEHIEIVSATQVGILTAVTYLAAQSQGEHLEICSAYITSAALTHINDL